MNSYILGLFAIFVIGILICGVSMIQYVILTKKYMNMPEDKTGLYDFIKVQHHLINVDHIINIYHIYDIPDEQYKIFINLDNSSEPLVLNFEENWQECEDVFEQISIALDPAQIVSD